MPTPQEATQQQVIIVDSDGNAIDWSKPFTVQTLEKESAAPDFDQQVIADSLSASNASLLLVAVLLALLLGCELVQFFYSAFRGK